MDADNINKPPLDALKSLAYFDYAQVRSVRATLFDQNLPATVSCQRHKARRAADRAANDIRLGH